MDLSGTQEIYVKTNLHTINLDSRIGTMTSSIIAKVPVVVDNIVKFVVAFVNVSILVSESYEVIIPLVVLTLDELNKFTKSVTL